MTRNYSIQNSILLYLFIGLTILLIENRVCDATQYFMKVIAGNSTGAITNGLTATKSKLQSPMGIWGDSAGNLYVAESSGSRIRQLTYAFYKYTTKTLIGTGTNNNTGGIGPATSTSIEGATSIYGMTDASQIYFSTNNYYLYRYTASGGTISRIAGVFETTGFNADSFANSSKLNHPMGLFLSDSGNLYFADSQNHRIRVISGTHIATVAGNGTKGFCHDNILAISSCLSGPSSVWIDQGGIIYIVDTGNHRIRRIISGYISTILGSGNTTYNGDYVPMTSVHLNVPLDFKGDTNGVYYLAELGRLRIIQNTMVRTIAGNGYSGKPPYHPTLATGAPAMPTALWVDSMSNIFYVDSSGYVVQVYAVPDPSSAPSAQPSSAPSVTIRDNVYYVKTIGGIGSVSRDSGDGGPALQAGFLNPRGLWQDANGNLYIAESSGSVIRKISPAGIVTRVVGTGILAATGESGPALNVTLNGAWGIFGIGTTIYFTGTVYFIWRYFPLSHSVSVFGGKIPAGFSGDNTPAWNASFHTPAELVVSTLTNLLYLADAGNHRIRTIELTTGIVQTVAGNGTQGFSGDGLAATSALLHSPFSIWVDSNEVGYIADTINNRIRAVHFGSSISSIYTYAGSGNYGTDTGPTAATSASFRNPYSVKGDMAGNLYIADTFNGLIRMIEYSTKTVLIIAGKGGIGFSPNTFQVATSVQFSNIYNLWVSSDGFNIYFSEPSTGYIRQLIKFGSPTSQPSEQPTSNPSIEILPGHSYLQLIAGSGTGHTDTGDHGPATLAQLNGPTGLWEDSSGTLYVTKLTGNRIRCINSLQIISTCFGSGKSSSSSGIPNFAPNVTFDGIWGLYGNQQNTLYIAGANYFLWVASNNNVNRFAGNTPAVATFAGNKVQALTAHLNSPRGLMLDAFGNLYFSDHGNHIIRMVDTNSIITTFAGIASTPGFSIDGVNATSASFNSPIGLWIDSLSQVYVADSQNQRIRVIRSNGQVFTIAGNGTAAYSGDYLPATKASLNNPFDVIGDATGNLYIADYSNCRVRHVNPAGIITTYIGSGKCGTDYSILTELTAIHLGLVASLWLNTEGSLYVVEIQGFIRQVIYLEYPSSRPSNIPSHSPSTTPSVIPSSQPTHLLLSYYLYPVAGTGTLSHTGDGGDATSATLAGPAGLWGDSIGNLYFCEKLGYSVRQVTPVGIILTVAGKIDSFSTTGASGAAGTTALDGCYGVVANNESTSFYISSGSYFLWNYLPPTLQLNRFAGSVPASNGDSGNGGPALSARLSQPMYMFLDTHGTLYFADYRNNAIRKISSNNTISIFAGSGIAGSIGDGDLAVNAQLYKPTSIWQDSKGTSYIADFGNHRVRYIRCTTNRIYTFAGTGNNTYNGDYLPATATNLNSPRDIKGDTLGNLYISEYNGFRVRKIVNGIVMVIAGTGKTVSSIPTNSYPLATSTSLGNLEGLWVNTKGEVFVASSTYQIYKLSTALPPTASPSRPPTIAPSPNSTFSPTVYPTSSPTTAPSQRPSSSPSHRPSAKPSTIPSSRPSRFPTSVPSKSPIAVPSSRPSHSPSARPTGLPSSLPTRAPTDLPTTRPSTRPSTHPMNKPSQIPSSEPSPLPTALPSSRPSHMPSSFPSRKPSDFPTALPSALPTDEPTVAPTDNPTDLPTGIPTEIPSNSPSERPSQRPSSFPSRKPSDAPSNRPSTSPTSVPSSSPSISPTKFPISSPSAVPSILPMSEPSSAPTSSPSHRPMNRPSSLPTAKPFVLSGRSILPGFTENLFLLGLFPALSFSKSNRNSNTSATVAVGTMVNFSHPVKNAESVVVLGSQQTNSNNNSEKKEKMVLDLSSSPSSNSISHVPNMLYSDQTSSAQSMAVILDERYPAVLLVGSPLTSSATVYRSYSTNNNSSEEDLLVAWYSLYGEKEKQDYFGWAVSSAGDQNQDGREDLLISAVYKGECYVIYGRSSTSSSTDLSMTNLTRAEGFRILGGQGTSAREFTAVGIAVAGLGDLNRDGLDDVSISVLSSTSQSMVIILFGRNATSSSSSALLGDIMLSDLLSGITTEGLVILAADNYFCGQSLAAIGDMNGDGYADLAIGTIPLVASSSSSSSRTSQEMAYVIYGRSNFTQRTRIFLSNLTAEEGLVLIGGGFMVAGIGDVNGDHLDDLLVISYESWQGKNNAYLIRFPVKVTAAPSPFPSSLPSSLPSLSPSSAPSRGGGRTNTPSLSPSSVSPVKVSTTRPSVQPSTRSHPPSLSPSKKSALQLTSTAPSVLTSQSPLSSLSPSSSSLAGSSSPLSPSSPSPPPTATSPSSGPSLLISSINSSVEIFYGQNGSSQMILLQSNELYPDLSIYGGSGRKIYVIYPKEDASRPANVILIHDFNLTEDVLDLSHLTSPVRMASIASLSFSTNPLTFYFANQEAVVLLSHASFDLTTKNFIFTPPLESKSSVGSQLLASLALILPAVLGFLCCALALTGSYREAKKVEQEEKTWWQQLMNPKKSPESASDGPSSTAIGNTAPVVAVGSIHSKFNNKVRLESIVEKRSSVSASSASVSSASSLHASESFVSFSDTERGEGGRTKGNGIKRGFIHSSNSSSGSGSSSQNNSSNSHGGSDSNGSSDCFNSTNGSDRFELLDV